MTRCEYLLWLLAEECSEVAQRASKSARFGLGEVQPGQPLTNARRICEEVMDLYVVLDLLGDEGYLSDLTDSIEGDCEEYCAAKRAKIEKYYRYSIECGTVDEAKAAGMAEWKGVD